MPVKDARTYTFEQAHQALLRELDECWTDLRAHYAQLNQVNESSTDYQDAKASLKGAMEALWRLKAAWVEVQ